MIHYGINLQTYQIIQVGGGNNIRLHLTRWQGGHFMKKNSLFIDSTVLNNFYTEKLPTGCNEALIKKNFYAGSNDIHMGKARNRKIISPIKYISTYINTLQYFEKEF